MTVVVTEECIGTSGYESKSAALRCAVKQSCEVGAVPHIGNPLQRPDGHLTRLRAVTYPARGHATRENTSSRRGSFSKPKTNNKTERRMRDSAHPRRDCVASRMSYEERSMDSHSRRGVLIKRD